MELLFEVTYHTYRAASMFSLVVVGQCEVLAMGNPSKEMDTYKGKYECSKFQEETIAPREKVICVEGLHEEAKVHGYPSTLVS